MNLKGSYSVISKRSLNPFGCETVYSVIVVTKKETASGDDTAYYVNAYVKSEDKICQDFGEYTYKIFNGKITVTEENFSIVAEIPEGGDLKFWLYFPEYFTEKARNLLIEIIKYLANR